ncbi:MAG: hypothetical protein ACK480_16005 [Planctomycetota bacterium]
MSNLDISQDSTLGMKISWKASNPLARNLLDTIGHRGTRGTVEE